MKQNECKTILFLICKRLKAHLYAIRTSIYHVKMRPVNVKYDPARTTLMRSYCPVITSLYPFHLLRNRMLF